MINETCYHPLHVTADVTSDARLVALRRDINSIDASWKVHRAKHACQLTKSPVFFRSTAESRVYKSVHRTYIKNAMVRSIAISRRSFPPEEFPSYRSINSLFSLLNIFHLTVCTYTELFPSQLQLLCVIEALPLRRRSTRQNGESSKLRRRFQFQFS